MSITGIFKRFFFYSSLPVNAPTTNLINAAFEVMGITNHTLTSASGTYGGYDTTYAMEGISKCGVDLQHNGFVMNNDGGGSTPKYNATTAGV